MKAVLRVLTLSLLAHTAVTSGAFAQASAQVLEAAAPHKAAGPQSIWADRRLIQLEKSSNLRDLGGYRTVDGKQVKWGRLYRSGAPTMLTENDLAALKQRNIVSAIDLRSADERRIAPSVLPGTGQYRMVEFDYPMEVLTRALTPTPQGVDKSRLYHVILTDLPQLFRQSFAALPTQEGAVLFHCSAGQDRTGLLSALILSALGVPRSTILADFHLSTPSRRAQYEMPPIDLSKFPGDKMAEFFAGLQQRRGTKAEPLYNDDGVSLLGEALDFIDLKWGSIDNYLRQVVGLKDEDFARLRAAYLE